MIFGSRSARIKHKKSRNCFYKGEQEMKYMEFKHAVEYLKAKNGFYPSFAEPIDLTKRMM